MTQYIIRRVLLMIPTLMGVSLLVTALVRLLPGDAVDILVSQGEVQGGSAILKQLVDARLEKEGIDPLTAGFAEQNRVKTAIIDEQLRKDNRDPATATDAQRADAEKTLKLDGYKNFIRAELGLDKNFIEQWWSWFADAARGDLGTSTVGGKDVSDELKARIPVSIELGVLGMLVSVLIALPTGVLSAVKQDRWPDYTLRAFAIAILAFPSFALATFVIALSSKWWNYSFPITYKDFWESPQSNLELVLVPAIILGIGLSGSLLRLTRAQMLEVLRQDYIRTARAKGLAARAVVIKHAVRNALIPVVTVIGLQVPVLIGGSLVLEQIFAIPGVARYLFTSINARDFPPMISIMMITAFIIVVVNLIVDLTYAALDPRIKLA
jgi:peptide/nickel transport system permease protein